MNYSPTPLGRRTFLRGALFAASAALLAACGSSTPPAPTAASQPAATAAPTTAPQAAATTAPAAQPTAATTNPTPTSAPKAAGQPVAQAAKLRYWQYFTEIQEEEGRLLGIYAKKAPNVTVQYEVIPWDQYWQKINATLAGGDAPDVWNTAPTFYYEYVKRGQLLGLDDYVKRDLDLTQFFQKTMSQWQVPQSGGPRYGVPRDWVIGVLYYNIDLFKKANVPLPTNDWTFDDLRDNAVKLTHATDDPQTAQFGFNLNVSHNFFNPMVYANGGKILDSPGGTRCVLDQGQVAINALQYLVDLVQKLKVSPPPGFFEGLGDPFQTGKVAMSVGITASIGTFRKITAFEWEIAQFPKGTAARNTYGGPDGLVLTKASPNHDASWELTNWLIGKEPGLAFYNAWGAIPLIKELAMSKEFLSVRPGNMQVAIDSEDFMYADFNAGYNEWNKALRDELTAAILQKKTAEQAIKDATKGIQGIIDKNQ